MSNLIRILPLVLACAISSSCAAQHKHPTNTTAKKNRKKAVADAHLQKIEVSRETGSMWLMANMRMGHRIFGYAKPDTFSEKLILLSIWTYDVEGNPHKCRYGAYYETNRMNDNGIDLKYISEEGAFIKANIVLGDTTKIPAYIEKRWVTFD
jgi:hypothetical protein